MRWFRLRRHPRPGSPEEMQVHIDLLVDQLMGQGRTLDEARREARLRFGNPRVKEELMRELSRASVLDGVSRDVRYALRILRRSPVFTLSSIFILAIVVGANGAVFGLVDAVLLREVPYPEPDRLGAIALGVPGQPKVGLQTRHSGVTWELLRDGASAIDLAVVRGGAQRVNLFAKDVARAVRQSRVGAGYFRVLGVPLALGREFTADEDRPGGPAVAVISHELWRDVFDADPSALGQALLLRGERYQVVGVAPAEFPNLGQPIDVFTPVRPARAGEGGGNNYMLIARIRADRSPAEAAAQLVALSANLAPGGTNSSQRRVLSLLPLKDELGLGARIPLAVLSAGGVILLIVACVNLAALFLGRGRTRGTELATRMALGGSRAVVVRQLMIEGLVLGAIGGLAGLVVGGIALRALQVLGGDLLTAGSLVVLDARVMAITAGVALVAALGFALVPAWQTSRCDPAAILVAGGSRTIAGRSRHWPARTLVAAEVTLGVVLVATAGMFLHAMLALHRTEPGFDPENLNVASLSLQDARYATSESAVRLFDVTVEALRRTQGIESAAVSLGTPYERLPNFPVRFADRPPPPSVLNTNLMYVTPGFFETLRIPARAGRVIAEGDRAGALPVAVVNQSFVRHLADGQNPIGRTINLGGFEPAIVGVVGDVQTEDPGFSLPGMSRKLVMAPPIVFVAAGQMPDSLIRLFHSFATPVWTIRATPVVNVPLTVARVIGAADSMLPAPSVRRMSDVRWDATRTPRLFATAIGVLAALALLLASVGLYGVVSQIVIERRREFGVRLALGASPRQILRRVSATGLILAMGSALVGLALAWLAADVLRALPLGLEAQDPLTFTAVAAMLGVIATIASVVPALGILRMDPASILRD
jgi:predicted permease